MRHLSACCTITTLTYTDQQHFEQPYKCTPIVAPSAHPFILFTDTSDGSIERRVAQNKSSDSDEQETDGEYHLCSADSQVMMECQLVECCDSVIVSG